MRTGPNMTWVAQWRHVTLHTAVSEAVDRGVSVDTSADDLRKLAAEFDVEIEESWSAGQIVLELFEKLVEHTLIAPTFIRDYPVETRPLTRAHRDDPRLAESWDLIVFGTEWPPGIPSSSTPLSNASACMAQSLLAAAGDLEAMQLDEDFLRAMEYGMPPTGGIGLGIDRLLMTLTGLGIRETHSVPARAERVTETMELSRRAESIDPATHCTIVGTARRARHRVRIRAIVSYAAPYSGRTRAHDFNRRKRAATVAQIREIRLVDDLDGESADETVEFGIDGKSYEIDLSKENAGRLRDVLADFVSAARRAGGRRRGGSECRHRIRKRWCGRGSQGARVDRPGAESGDPRLGAQARHEGLRPWPHPGRGARGVSQGELSKRGSSGGVGAHAPAPSAVIGRRE